MCVDVYELQGFTLKKKFENIVNGSKAIAEPKKQKM